MTDTPSKLNWTPNRHLQIGDRVVMQMDAESRSWGRKGPKDGTQGTVIGKYRAKVFRHRWGVDVNFYEPGIYEQDGICIVHWDDHDPDITVVDGLSRTSPGNLGEFTLHPLGPKKIKLAMEMSRTNDQDMAMLDQDEAARRRQADWITPVHEEKKISITGQEQKLLNAQRIADLPETMAWEGDRIIPSEENLLRTDEERPVHLRVHMIHYDWVPHSPHTYMVQWHFNDTGEDARMGSTYIHDKDIAALERGNVWKHYHGEDLSFASLEEEIVFAHQMGMTKEVRNPLENNLYRWSLDEALDAIQENRAHGITAGGIMMPGDRINLYRFKDSGLAARVRQKTLEGFNRAA